MAAMTGAPAHLETPTAPEPQRLGRVFRQHLQTTRLLGVDFVPLGRTRANPSPQAGSGQVATPPPDPSAVVEVKGQPRSASSERGSDNERERRRALLEELRGRHDAQCPHCTNAQGWTHTVFGEGDPCARLMFVGEAPGADEDRTGRPFVGRAGQKLDDMIKAMGLRREEVFIANVLKTRPPQNATPTPEEAERCGPYLREQIGVIRPVVIVTLGKPAANYLLGNREAMGSLRGRWAMYGDIPLMPTFHPAYLLRAYTRENREKVWSDLQQAMTRLRGGA